MKKKIFLATMGGEEEEFPMGDYYKYVLILDANFIVFFLIRTKKG